MPPGLWWHPTYASAKGLVSVMVLSHLGALVGSMGHADMGFTGPRMDGPTPLLETAAGKLALPPPGETLPLQAKKMSSPLNIGMHFT